MKIHREKDEDKYKVKEDRKKATHREKSFMDRHLYVGILTIWHSKMTKRKLLTRSQIREGEKNLFRRHVSYPPPAIQIIYIYKKILYTFFVPKMTEGGGGERLRDMSPI